MGAREQAQALVAWADQHWNDRLLPWRSPEEPHDRRALVEGLLAQTRADAVARAYFDLFAGVKSCCDWLSIPAADRAARVAPLGLGAMKLRAVNGIAEVIHFLACGEVPREILAVRLEDQPGVGPYTAAMVGLLLGAEAAPVDTNIDRVGRRVAPTVAPCVWIAEVVAAARVIPAAEAPASLGAFPPAYVAVSMALDVGAGPCAAGQYPECERCPLQGDCWYAEHGKVQRLLPL